MLVQRNLILGIVFQQRILVVLFTDQVADV